MLFAQLFFARAGIAGVRGIVNRVAALRNELGNVGATFFSSMNPTVCRLRAGPVLASAIASKLAGEGALVTGAETDGNGVWAQGWGCSRRCHEDRR